MTSNEPKSVNPLLYAEAMGVVLSTVYGLRSTVHMTDHLDPDKSQRSAKEDVFVKYWKKWLNDSQHKAEQLWTNENKAKHLLNYSERKGTEYASWRLPCSNEKCKFYLDLPFPVTVQKLKSQVDIAFTDLFNKVLRSEIKLEWYGAALIQSTITMALSGIPHYSILYYLDNDQKTPIASSSHKWFTESESKIFDKISYLIKDKKDPLPAYDVNRNELIEILFGENFLWEKGKDLLSLQNLLIWDRIGKKDGFASLELFNVDSLLDNPDFASKIEECENKGNQVKTLINYLPFNAVYFLTALAVSPTPAFVLHYQLGESKLYNFVLVPNFYGLNSFVDEIQNLTKEDKLISTKNDWEDISKHLYNNSKLPKSLSKIFTNPKLENLNRDQIKWTFKEINKSKFSEDRYFDKNNYEASKTIFYIPIDKVGREIYTEEFMRIRDSITTAKAELREKLGLKENQLWILRVRYEPDYELPFLDFLLFGKMDENDKMDFNDDNNEKKELAKSLENGDVNKYIKNIIQSPPRPTGIVGESYRSLKFSHGISVLGDFRTMDIIGANGTIKTYDDLFNVKDKEGTIGEFELSAKYYRDFYSFPIFVGQRLWGMLEIADRGYDNKCETDILEDQYHRIWQGTTIANHFGQMLEKLFVDAAEVVLFRRLSIFISDTDINDDLKIKKVLRRIFSKVLSSLPFIADINYHVSAYKDKNKPKENWEYDNYKDHIFTLTDTNNSADLGIKAFIPIEFKNSYEANRLKEIFQYSLTDTTNARRANIDAAAGVETRQYKEVQEDINNLIQKISEARITAVKIEEVLNKAKTGLLKVSLDVQNLFNQKRGKYYYGKDKCVLSEDKDKFEFIKDNDNDNKVYFIECTHDISVPDNSIDLWKKFAEYLQAASEVYAIKLFSYFKPTNSRNYAINQFNLLKLLEHNSQRIEPLYFIQLIASCISPIAEFSEIEFKLKINKKTYLFKNEKWGLFFELIKAGKIPKRWLDSKCYFRTKLENIRPSSIMSALMILIGTELTKGNLPSNQPKVYIESAEINVNNSLIEVQLICNNIFQPEDIKKITSLDDESKLRGLRSCIKSLCEGVGQVNPFLMRTIDINEIRNTKVISLKDVCSKFIIGINDKKTIFFLSFKKEEEPISDITEGA